MKPEMLHLAKQIATEAHKGQKRKTGGDYICHPERIAEQFDEKNIDLKVIAWLHDVVEDTATTLDELKKHFPKYITKAIDCLTKRDGESYLDFILRCKTDSMAIAVKIKDLEDNLRDLEQGNLREKYLLAYYLLANKRYNELE